MTEVLEQETVTELMAELQAWLWAQLKTHGMGRLAGPGLAEPVTLANLLRHQGQGVAALLAAVLYRGYNLQLLWVREDFRGRGLGRRLLGAAEQQAQAHRCTVIFGFSFGFQAPDYYTRAGYRIFGAIEDYPAGYNCHFLSKRLDAMPAG